MNLSKNDSLAMKGIAILMMYVHHFYLSPERWDGYSVNFFPLTASSTLYIAQFFKICVSIFVFITGYGMIKSIKRQNSQLNLSSMSILSYTHRRLFSLLSNFIFVFLLVIIVSFPTGRFFEVYGKSGSSLLYFVIDMFGLAKLFKTPTYVGTWWYMSLAIVLIILFPLLVKLYREYKWTFLLAVVFIPRMIGLKVADKNLLHWILAMVLGMYCADTGLFERWRNFEKTKLRKIPAVVLFFIHLFILAAFVVFRQCSAGQELLDVFDGIIPVYVVFFCRRYILPLRGLRQVLMFLGQHSMNMFLIHTFIREIYFEKFSYGFGNAWINVAVLIIDTLLLSMLIELIKKLVHFNVLQSKIRRNN